MKGGNVVTTAYALAIDHDVWYCFPASRLEQLFLQLGTKRMQVQLYDERWRIDRVFLEQNCFRFLRVRAVGLGEDDDCSLASEICCDSDHRRGGGYIPGDCFSMPFSSCSTS